MASLLTGFDHDASDFLKTVVTRVRTMLNRSGTMTADRLKEHLYILSCFIRICARWIRTRTLNHVEEILLMVAIIFDGGASGKSTFYRDNGHPPPPPPPPAKRGKRGGAAGGGRGRGKPAASTTTT